MNELYKYKENFINESDNILNHMEVLMGSSNMNTEATIFNIEVNDKMECFSNLITYPANDNEEIQNQLIIDKIEPIVESELEKLNYKSDYDKEEPPKDDYMYLCEIKTYLNMISLKCNYNIYRQSFILLIALFEATFFDILNIIINKNFFAFVNSIDIKDSFKLKEIAKFDSFENFKTDFIDNFLESNRIKSLLHILYIYNKEYFIVNEIDVSKKIYEIIARRNLHLHKNGIVDKNYFKQSLGNIYDLKIEDYTEIGYVYYKRTYDILENFVSNLTKTTT